MVKINFKLNTSSEVYSFGDFPISIGTDKSHPVDFAIPQQEFMDPHLLIEKEGEKLYVKNVANDPFISLNSTPFGKMELHDGDQIQMGDVLLHCSIEAESDFSLNLESLFEQVDTLDNEISPPIDDNVVHIPSAPPPPPPPPPPPKTQKIIEEDLSLANATMTKEDHFHTDVTSHLKPKNELWNRWKLWVSGLAILFTIFVLFGLITYINLHEQSKKERIIAAEGAADVAMALTYAQFHRISADKQNWFDLQFLKHNLTPIVSTEHPSIADIDNHGQFSNCNYLLRIYTSKDLSRFIVIAQPEHSLLQSIVPKSAVVVDSLTMELRSVNDIKALNRLLTHHAPLDSEMGKEISALVKQGDLIPLTFFPAKKGLTPPKVIALARPGAEHLIYNAPRYFHFSEEILNRAALLLQEEDNIHELERLKQQVELLQQLPQLVLYSSQGMEKAIEGQKAVKIIAPDSNFLTAYLHLDAHGVIKSSHILLNEEYLADTAENSTAIALATESAALDASQMLYLKLRTIVRNRQEVLQKSADSILKLLQEHRLKHEPQALERLELSFKEYIKVNEEQRNSIARQLEALYKEYQSSVSYAEFTNFLKELKLETFDFKKEPIQSYDHSHPPRGL